MCGLAEWGGGGGLVNFFYKEPIFVGALVGAYVSINRQGILI